MKKLHLDIELARSGIELTCNNETTISASDKDATMREKDIDREQNVSLADTLRDDVHQFSLDKVCYVNMTKENVPGNNTTIKDITIGSFRDCREVGLQDEVNTTFVTDSDNCAPQIDEDKRPDSCTMIGEIYVDQTLGAAIIDGPSKTVDDSKKTMEVVPHVFRNKVLKTIFLLWNAACLGWGYGQMGPVFPDLLDLAEVSLKQGSWLFTGYAIGYLTGCLLAGFTQTRFSPNLLLFLYTMVSACSFVLLPWIPIFSVMVFLRVTSGIGLGGQDTVFLTMLFAIWGNKTGPVIQLIHVLVALGGIVSPLVTKPFLRKVNQNGHVGTSYTTESVVLLNWTVTLSSDISKEKADIIETDTNVHYALLISGLLFLSAALPFLVAFIKEPRATGSRQKSVENSDKAVENKLPKRIEKIILIILFFNSFVGTACIDLFPSFLSTFLMEQIDWSRQDGSTLTSLFFAMYAAGNFINIFVTVHVKTTKILVFSYVSSVVVLSGCFVSVFFTHTELIWATVSLSGAAISNIKPMIFMWTQQYVTPITASVASGLLIFGSLGISVNALLVGHMMEGYSPMWFIYLSLGYIVLCAVLFFAAMILTKIYSIKGKMDQNETEQNQHKKEIRNGQTDVYSNGYVHTTYEITHL